MSITLKIKIDNFIIAATDCDMLGRVANTPAHQQSFRLRSEELRRIASALRADLIQRELSDAEFLADMAAQLLELATLSTQDNVRTEPVAMAKDMEERVGRKRNH
jgi:hypothetical protein